MTGTLKAPFTILTYVRITLTNVVVGNGSLNRTIYCYIWDIIFTCSTYYRVMLLVFVCVRISHYRVQFTYSRRWRW